MPKRVLEKEPDWEYNEEFSFIHVAFEVLMGHPRKDDQKIP